MVTERNFGVGCRSSEWNNRSEKSEIRSEKHQKTGKWTLKFRDGISEFQDGIWIGISEGISEWIIGVRIGKVGKMSESSEMKTVTW